MQIWVKKRAQKILYISLLNKIYWKIRPATRAYFYLLQRPSAIGKGFFLPFGQKKQTIIMLFWPIFGNFGVQ